MKNRLASAAPLLALLFAACADTNDLTGGASSQGGSSDNGTRPDDDGTRDGGGGSGFGTGGNASGTGGMVECGDVELCDGVDNNCDGQTDEGCDCNPGETRACFSGDPALAGVGTCAEGIQDCDETGKWSVACSGEVLPVEEECDGDDNDCNGTADDGFGDVSCGDGLCAVTVPICEDGVLTECVPLDPPDGVEDCDGVDDNCDGDVDEGCTCTNGTTQPCYTGPMGTDGVGPCTAGTQTCAGGQWGDCVGQVLPASETCDAVDQDCDGNVNEGNCSLPNALSSCTGGGCAISSCSSGYDNCDNNATNGCEARHSGYSNSSPGQDLGAFEADAFYGFGCVSDGCDGPVATYSGTQGRYFQLDALEESSCCSYLSVRIELIVPPGIDYDLYTTGSACFADPGFSSAELSGVDESIVLWCEDDCNFGDDSFDIGVEVRYYGGASCTPYTLNVYRGEC